MPKIDNKTVIGVKTEATQGNLASLAATDYMLCEDTSSVSVMADKVIRNPRRSSLDSLTHLVGKTWVEFDITTEIKGSGVAGTAYLPFGAAYIASGYVESAAATQTVTGVPVTAGGTGYLTSFPVTFTGGGGTLALAFAYAPGGIISQIIITNPGTGYTTPPTAVITAGGGTGGTVGTVTLGASVAYLPTSNPATNFFTPSKSATIEFYKDGLRHSAAGCVGTVVETYELEKVCYATFKMKGKYTAVTDAALPTQTYLSQVPVLVDNVNFRCMDFASVATKLTIDTGNTIAMRGDFNTAGGITGFMVTKRDSKGSFNPEAETVATHDFFGKLKAGTEGITCLKLGTVAGNTIWSICPKTQYDPFKYSNRDGIVTFDIPLDFNQYLGDDWHSLVMF